VGKDQDKHPFNVGVVKDIICIENFPHIKDKVRVVNNVWQSETMEDMGRSVPRIYAALENKKA
jgi:hypothetical protein